MRCMRMALSRIVSTNRCRCAGGIVSSSSVSANPLTAVNGVLSSWDTLATKSRRIVSSRRSTVRSSNVSTAPAVGSGREVIASVRSFKPTSAVGVAWPSSAWSMAARMAYSRGSSSRPKGSGAEIFSSPRARSLMRTTDPPGDSASTPSSRDSSRAIMRSSSSCSARIRLASCSPMRVSAVASSPTSPGAASDGRCVRSPAAMARATLRSSTTGWEIVRANTHTSSSTPSNATRPLASTSCCAPRTTVSRRCVVIDTRTVPSGWRTATYNSSSPADALGPSAAPTPRSRAAMTSGRVA